MIVLIFLNNKNHDLYYFYGPIMLEEVGDEKKLRKPDLLELCIYARVYVYNAHHTPPPPGDSGCLQSKSSGEDSSKGEHAVEVDGRGGTGARAVNCL